MSNPVTLPAEEVTLPAGHGLARLAPVALAVGAVALVGAYLVAGGFTEAFSYSYLIAYLFFLTLALGGLFFTLLHFLTRAGWSVVVRRLSEQVMATLPLFVVLFVPVVVGFGSLYHWAHPEGDPLLEAKAPFLNEPFFLVRAAIYFAVWCGLGWWFRRQSIRQDESGDPAITRRLQSLSAPGMVAFAVTLSFASFDWVMSLDPHWYSTIFGVYIFSGCVVGILSLMAILIAVLQRAGALEHAVNAEHLHDLGKLLFAFVVFWAYIAFSQFLLIWYANIPEETVWFQHRWHHGWRPISIALAVGHFALPFLVLLSRSVKRRAGALAVAAVWLLAMHYLDLYWLIVPSLHHGEGSLPWLLNLVTFVAVGGLFFGTLGLLLRRPALVPVRDPRLPESLSFENM